jgi:hypothetical protein
MAKRSTDWMTVRGIKEVGDVPARGAVAGLWTRSLDIVIREQGNRELRLRMTTKNARLLRDMLVVALS